MRKKRVEYPYKLKAGFCLVFGVLSLLGTNLLESGLLALVAIVALFFGAFIYLKGKHTESIARNREYDECIIRMNTRDFWLTPLFYVLLVGYFLALSMQNESAIVFIALLCIILMVFYVCEYLIALFKLQKSL